MQHSMQTYVTLVLLKFKIYGMKSESISHALRNKNTLKKQELSMLAITDSLNMCTALQLKEQFNPKLI